MPLTQSISRSSLAASSCGDEPLIGDLGTGSVDCWRTVNLDMSSHMSVISWDESYYYFFINNNKFKRARHWLLRFGVDESAQPQVHTTSAQQHREEMRKKEMKKKKYLT